MHFGGFSATKSVYFRGCVPASGPYPRSLPLFAAFGSIFGS